MRRTVGLIGSVLLCLGGSAAGEDIKADVKMNGTWHEKSATRERFCLNGEWDFHPLLGTKNHEWALGPEITEVDTYDWKMKIRVPSTWKAGGHHHEEDFFAAAEVAHLNNCMRAWYKRSFFVPADWDGKQMFLEFGVVGYKAAVYINRNHVSTHVGGYTPFKVDITPHARPGQVNEVLVFNASFGRGWAQPAEPVLVIGNHNGGICGDVYLRANSKVFTDDVFVKTSVRKGKLTAILEIVNRGDSDRQVQVENVVVDGEKTVLTLPARQVTIPAGGMSKVEVAQDWANPRYWSCEDPHLVHLVTRIREGDKLVDEARTRFGFREFWIDGKDFRLNGEVIRLRDFPVVTDFPAETRPEWIRGWYKLMKEKLNHNHIRFQWIFPTHYIEIADEVGLLIEDATGFIHGHRRARWNSPAAHEQSARNIAEWVRSRRNSPSIVLWSTNNEVFSMLDVKNCRDGDPEALGIHKWLVQTGDRIREHDETRVITNHHVAFQFDYTASYFEEHFEAGDLMGDADNYNLHYPQEGRYLAEQVDLGRRWAREKNKPLIIGEFCGPQTSVPGNTNGFAINGEEYATGGDGERKAQYYFFRRVVGGWRSAGVSGIYPWYPNLYSIKKQTGNQRFTWDDLTTPYMKPVKRKNLWYNPGWNKDFPEYVPGSVPPSSGNWDLLADTFTPLLINLEGEYWEHNYLGSERVTRTAHLVNDTPAAQHVTWSWVLEEDGKRLAGKTQTTKVARSEIKPVSFEMQLPRARRRRQLTLLLTARAGEFASKDSVDITVYPAEAVATPVVPKTRIALYDPAGKTAGVLDKMGIRYRKIDTLARGLKPGKDKVLIVGCDSADASLKETVMDIAPINVIEHIQKFTASGGTVVVFEQGRETYGNLHQIFPGVVAPPLERHVSYHPCSFADVAAPGHPIFKGLGKAISLWKGEFGRIAEFHYPRPFGTTATPLLFSWKWGTSLIEGIHGKGRYLLCQTNLTTRYGSDPEATILMHNLLGYALSPPPVARVKAATVGDIGGLLGGFTAGNLARGFAAADITGKLSQTDLSQYAVLILGRETLGPDSEVSTGASKILDFAAAGGTVFVLPQSPATFKADWLPGKIGIREMASQFIFKEDTADPLLWGVSAFDLTRYYHYGGGLMNEWTQPKVTAEFHDWSGDWTSLLFVSKEPGNWNPCELEPIGGVFPTDGSAMLQAKHGKGRIILCQLNLGQTCKGISEEVLEDLETPKLAPRVLTDMLLTNLGLAVAESTGRVKTGMTRRESVWAMQRLKDDVKAYPSAWKIIGPFPNINNQDFKTVQGPQQDILAGRAAAQDYPGDKGKQVSWKVVAPNRTRDGFVDVDLFFGKPDWVTAYATMTVKSPTARKAIFFLGTDDGFRLWLNGELIGELDMARGATPMSENFRVDLKEGDNVVLLKITEQVGDFSFYFSMMDDKGKVLRDCVTDPGDPGKAVE